MLREELHYLYFLVDIIRMIKSKRKRKNGAVKRNKGKNAHRVLVRKPEKKKRPIARTILR